MAVETFSLNIAQTILEKLGSLALQEVGLAWGAKNDLKRLKKTLSAVKALLLDAEERSHKNRQLTDWLKKLQDVFYDADDLLDELEYEALQSQALRRDRRKQKVHNPSSSLKTPFSHLKIGRKVKKIRERLDDIDKDRAQFQLSERDAAGSFSYSEREMTHSFVNASDVIGRHQDRETIIDLLMRSDHEDEGISVIPIVGIGGLGKTMLTKFVYNNERVVRHFELQLWVCVSENFDVKLLVENIIESAGDQSTGQSMDTLQKRLRKIFESKKVLLVLDDIWSEDRRKWIDFISLLREVTSGSKIIVTTRSHVVASNTGTFGEYKLEGLPHDECMSLFVKWAFKKGEERNYPKLVQIGEDIVRKCKGVPLAIRTLGSLLYSKTNERDWLDVRDSDLWKLEQTKTDILPALRLSYEHLPYYLKQCFSYCSIFPKDHVFERDQLIRLWMAQGFIRSSKDDQELEYIGIQYFNYLCSLSFFQEAEDVIKWDLSVGMSTWDVSCKMHDIVHDLALYVSQEDLAFITHSSSNINEKGRHVALMDDDLSWKKVSQSMLKANKLRTMLTFKVTGAQMNMWCSKFKYLRVLKLPDSSLIEIPSSIGSLVHLRYLDLNNNKQLRELPKSICKLYQLQSLFLEGCYRLEELPSNIRHMISLRYFALTTMQKRLEGIQHLTSLRTFEINSCYNLVTLPKEMGSLTHLQTLIIFSCVNLASLPSTMKYLTRLENLAIIYSEKLNLEEFDGFKNLKSLKILFLDQLVTLPRWLGNLSRLQKLEIANCYSLSSLPEGACHLNELKKLEIRGCPKLSRRCRPQEGEDWQKIAHVPEIHLDRKRITPVDYEVRHLPVC